MPSLVSETITVVATRSGSARAMRKGSRKGSSTTSGEAWNGISGKSSTGGRRLELAADAVHQSLGAKADRIVSRQARLLGHARDLGACLALRQRRGIEGDRHDT